MGLKRGNDSPPPPSCHHLQFYAKCLPNGAFLPILHLLKSHHTYCKYLPLFKSPILFFFFSPFDQQQQSKNKGDLNADELPALFVHSHCTQAGALSPSECLDHTSAAASRDDLVARPAGSELMVGERSKDKAVVACTRREVVLHFGKPSEKIPVGAVALTGCEAVVYEW